MKATTSFALGLALCAAIVLMVAGSIGFVVAGAYKMIPFWASAVGFILSPVCGGYLASIVREGYERAGIPV